jgi:hypothetical protein
MFSCVYAQNDSIAINKRFKGGMKLGTFHSIALGNNMLGSGHSTGGLGFESVLAVPVTSYGFGFGAGIQFSSFKAVDERFLGNITGTVVRLYSLQAFYQSSIHKKWTLEYALGVGFQPIRHQGLSITGRVGTGLILGVVTKYDLADHFGFYGGVNYVAGFHDIEAPAEVKSYYERNHQLQIVLGIRF